MVKGIDAYKKLRQKLENPPPHQEMLSDLRMNSVSVRQKGGDIEVLKIADKTILERVWRLYQINTFISEQSERLLDGGVITERLFQDAHLLAEELRNKTPNQNKMEGFVDEGFLEIEVFARERYSKN